MGYDVVIVGAGSAGCVLASRLSEDPHRSVLLIEAGPDYKNLEDTPSNLKDGLGQHAAAAPPHIWIYLADPTMEPAEPMPLVSGRVVGGSSSINGQTFLRGLPEDYDHWAKAGNPEWSFDNCLPYFRRLENDLDFSGEFHGSKGPIPVRRHKSETWLPLQRAIYESGRRAGFPDNPDMNHPRSTGVGPIPTNNHNGIRTSTAIAYLMPIRQRQNLTILANTVVRQILLDGSRAVGVELETDGSRSVVHGHEIVLSAGAIRSPQLLMVSGIGPETQMEEQGIKVRRSLPGVGMNLMDHPLTIIRLGDAGNEYPVDSDQPIFQTGIVYTSRGSDNRNDVIIQGESFTDPPEKGQPFGPQAKLANVVVSILYPFSRGVLTLISPDIAMQPRLEYRYLSDPRDLHRSRDAVRLVIDLMEDASFKSLPFHRLAPTNNELSSDKGLEAWLLQNVSSSYHSSGTCKMGPSTDPAAVVDQYCKVIGIDGLRVVDASVFPDHVSANSNSTVIMIAERVADWIRDIPA